MKRVLFGIALLVGLMAAGYGYAVTRWEANYRELLLVGDAAAARGDFVAAIEAFSGARALKPDSMAAHLKRGEAYWRRRELESATRDLRRAIELDPSAPRPRELLGDVSYAMGRYDRAAAHARREQGFSAVKMNATAELDWIGTPRLFGEVIERVEAAQAAGMDVGLDFHGRVHRPMAKQLAKALEPLGLLFIEEPLLSESPEGLRQMAELTSIPIALGERLFSRWDFKPFFESGAVDIIQPDLSHAGGILECRKIAAMAEAYDIAVAPHCPLGPLALAACLQLAACTPNVAVQEMSLGIHYNVGADLFSYCGQKEQLTPNDGYLTIPTGPGLGVDIDEDVVRESNKDRHRWRNPVWRLADGSFAEW